MLIGKSLAGQIAAKAQQVLKRDIILTDLTGELLAEGSAPRTPVFIPEALSVAQTGHASTNEFENRSIRWWPFVYEEQTIAVFGLSLESGPITQEAMTLLQGLAEVIVYQHFLLDKIQSAERIRADFIKTTLTAQTLNEIDVYRQADILQLNLQNPQAAILIQADGLEESVRKQHGGLSQEEQQLHIDEVADQLSTALRETFKNLQDNLVAYLGNDVFIVLKGIGGDSPTTLNTIRFMTEKAGIVNDALHKLSTGYTITIGIGQYYPGLGGLRKSYQDAKLALEVGAKVWGSGRVYHIKNVGMFITLAGTTQTRKAELAYQILSPLLRDEQLFKTIQAFLANGLNLTDAAEKLHIHRNTLIYRLDKTKKLIGLDPRHFDDALQIKLGLMFYQEPGVISGA